MILILIMHFMIQYSQNVILTWGPNHISMSSTYIYPILFVWKPLIILLKKLVHTVSTRMLFPS